MINVDLSTTSRPTGYIFITILYIVLVQNSSFVVNMRTGVVFCIGVIAGGLISLIYVLTRTERKRRRKNDGGGGPYSGSSHLEINGRVSDGNRYAWDTISRIGGP